MLFLNDDFKIYMKLAIKISHKKSMRDDTYHHTQSEMDGNKERGSFMAISNFYVKTVYNYFNLMTFIYLN